MLLYAFILIVGVGISLYAFLEISVWGSLYFDRDYRCIEKYRKLQKRSDIISAIHNLFISYSGIVVVFAGVTLLFNRSDINLDWWFFIALVGLVIDRVILQLSIKKWGMLDIKNEIKNMWKKNKKASAENDHEVNMYRGAERICDKYPGNNLFCLIVLLLVWMCVIIVL